MPAYAGDEADDHPIAEIVRPFSGAQELRTASFAELEGSSRRDESLQLFCPVQDDLHLRGGG